MFHIHSPATRRRIGTPSHNTKHINRNHNGPHRHQFIIINRLYRPNKRANRKRLITQRRRVPILHRHNRPTTQNSPITSQIHIKLNQVSTRIKQSPQRRLITTSRRIIILQPRNRIFNNIPLTNHHTPITTPRTRRITITSPTVTRQRKINRITHIPKPLNRPHNRPIKIRTHITPRIRLLNHNTILRIRHRRPHRRPNNTTNRRHHTTQLRPTHRPSIIKILIHYRSASSQHTHRQAIRRHLPSHTNTTNIRTNIRSNPTIIITRNVTIRIIRPRQRQRTRPRRTIHSPNRHTLNKQLKPKVLSPTNNKQ